MYLTFKAPKGKEQYEKRSQIPKTNAAFEQIDAAFNEHSYWKFQERNISNNKREKNVITINGFEFIQNRGKCEVSDYLQ